MRPVAMVVRSAGHEQPEAPRDLEIVGRGLRVVIGVIGFQRVGAIGGEPGNPLVADVQAGMGDRCDPAGLVNPAEHFVRRSAGARHERWPPAPEKLRKRFVRVVNAAGSDQRPRNRRAANGLRRIVKGGLHQRLAIERDAEIGQAADHRAHAIDPGQALRRQEPGEAGRCRIDEISQHVHVGRVVDRGHFDARHERDPARGAGGGGFDAPGCGVVIGDAQHRDTRRNGTGNEARRCIEPVRCRRVSVEIDQCAPRDRRCRLWRWRSARSSRMRSSRWARSSSANTRNTCLPSESSNRSP